MVIESRTEPGAEVFVIKFPCGRAAERRAGAGRVILHALCACDMAKTVIMTSLPRFPSLGARVLKRGGLIC